MLPASTSPLSNTSPIRTPLDRKGKLTFVTPAILPRMVLIGSSFMPRREKREWGCTLSLLGLTWLLDLENLLPLPPLVCLPMNRKKDSCPSIPMMKVSVQLNVCCRNETNWCSENDFTTCTTADDRADIFDAVFGAGIKAGVNVQQYQWGQRNLTSIPRGPIRRQDPEEQNTLGTSYDDGYAECATSLTTSGASILNLRL